MILSQSADRALFHSLSRCAVFSVGVIVTTLQGQSANEEGIEPGPTVLPTWEVMASPWPVLPGPQTAVTTAALENEFSSLHQVLAPLPGLTLMEGFGRIDPPRISVRGSGLQSAPASRGLELWLDGHPLGFADGSFHLSFVENTFLRHAELRAGSLAGVAALGGILSMVSAGAAELERYSMQGLMTSDQTVGASLHFSDARADAQTRVLFAGVKEEGWRTYSEQKRESFLLHHRQSFGPRGEDSWMIHFMHVRPRFEVPGPLTKSQAMERPKEIAFIIERDKPFRKSELSRLAGSMHILLRDWEMDAGWLLAYHGDYFQQLLPNGITEASGPEAAFFINLQSAKSNASESNFLSMQIVGQRGARQQRRYRNQAGTPGSQISDVRLEAETARASLDYAWSADNSWRMETGLSLLHGRRQITPRMAQAADGSKIGQNFTGARLAPRVMLVYDNDSPWKWWSAVSRGWEAPTFDDLLFLSGPPMGRVLEQANLAWQRADTIESGVEWRYGNSIGSLRLFHGIWQNELLRLVDSAGSPRGTVNAERTQHSGLELSYRMIGKLSGGLKYRTWLSVHGLDLRFRGDPVHRGNRLAGLPPWQARTGVRLSNSQGLFLQSDGEVRHGRTFADHANQLAYGGTFRLHLMIGRDWPDFGQIRLGVHNLLDRRSIGGTAGVLDRVVNPASTLVFLPAAPRRLELVVERTW